MAHNDWLGKGNDAYHLISPITPKSDISTGELSSVAPPSAPRSRYWTRTIIGLLVPLSVTGYYYWIWQYLLSRPQDDAIKFGSATEIWVYYSWFIIGVFALEWSKHGLVGVEVAMLETKTFGARHLVALLSHSEGTWSGPGGWFKCITKAFKKNQSGAKTSLGDSLKTYKLWYILAFISLSLYVGMPLSGLTMELSDGYVRLKEAPMVVGRNSTNFHKRYEIQGETTKEPAPQALWQMGSPATLPGIGIIFTPDYFNREGHDNLAETPNRLPTDQRIPEMFIVPQALGPISGRPWGLRVGYNCSIVEDVSEFTVLGHYTGRWCRSFWPSHGNSTKPCATAQMFERTNIWSYSEVGSRLDVKETQASQDTIGNKQEPLVSTDTQVNVLEWAVWQARTNASVDAIVDGKVIEIENFNSTVGTTVRGIGSPFMKASNGSWFMNTTFFEQRNYTNEVDITTKKNVTKDTWNKFDHPRGTIQAAAAIGVRCTVRSVFGSATVDARTSSFFDFQNEEPTPYDDPEVNAEEPVSRLGTIVEAVASAASLEDIFKSINVRATNSESNSVLVSKFVTSEDLQKSVYLAWGQEVLNHMYDSVYGFETSWPYANLTSSKKGKVLTKGELPPISPNAPRLTPISPYLPYGAVFGTFGQPRIGAEDEWPIPSRKHPEAGQPQHPTLSDGTCGTKQAATSLQQAAIFKQIEKRRRRSKLLKRLILTVPTISQPIKCKFSHYQPLCSMWEASLTPFSGVEMTSPTNQESSRLFELPWEIRERIYEYYLSFDHDDFGDTLRPLHLYIEQGGYSKPIPPLMLTSKRAYRELHQRVHSDAVMRVHTAGWGDRRIGFAVHGKLRFERLRRLYVLVAMEYPNWNRWLGMLGEVARRAKNLSELVVDWEPRPSGGNTKVWEAKLTERKHDEFFKIISDLKNLQVVKFHGDMPAGWRDRFARETSARLVLYKSKWWKEPGME
ncbi:hypothetical protein GQ607_004738 [Colletotrichum asianum]|uniref:Uncharacterized protein n=1 Tax=Colletotrichum asianum TaxID=702518 RepID=A0A8H3ZUH8_9PEZI|nr:hypothetical protein GQ607_004738 [Colletotrichum asianum]